MDDFKTNSFQELLSMNRSLKNARTRLHKELEKSSPNVRDLEFWIHSIRAIMYSERKKAGLRIDLNKTEQDKMLRDFIGEDYDKARELILKTKSQEVGNKNRKRQVYAKSGASKD